ncbi:MAG: AAA family ATPase [Selenomonadaceae bacterium]|nr:AAA family ATPase [Selenomonadaceae bacterium]
MKQGSVIISVFSTTPGIGKTLTAINLATRLSNAGNRVCLLDLDLQFGDVMHYLKLSSDKTIATAQWTLKNEPEKFDIKDFLVDYMPDYFTLSILAAPVYVRDAYQIDVTAVETIITEYLKDFDFIVLDLSSAFSSLNLAMLDLSTVINYLGVIDFLPALKNYKIGYDTLIRFEYEEQKIRLVENRADSQKLINSSDVEKLLGEPFYHRLPNDFAAANRSIQEGNPLMFSATNSRLDMSFLQLASKYSDGKIILPKQEEEEKPKKGFFSQVIDNLFG